MLLTKRSAPRADVNLLREQGKRYVIGLAAGTAKSLGHPQRAVGVARVDHDGGGRLLVGSLCKPGGNGIAGLFVVRHRRVIVFRQKVVVEKDRVVRA